MIQIQKKREKGDSGEQDPDLVRKECSFGGDWQLFHISC